MSEETEIIIDKQFKSLPIALQQALNIVPWKEDVRNIAQDMGLDQEKTDLLEAETMLVLYGLQDLADFPNNLTKEVGLEESQALDVADELFSKVFTVISEKMVPTTAEETLRSTPEIVERHEELAEGVQVESRSMNQESGVGKAESGIGNQESGRIGAYPLGQDPYREPLE